MFDTTLYWSCRIGEQKIIYFQNTNQKSKESEV